MATAPRVRRRLVLCGIASICLGLAAATYWHATHPAWVRFHLYPVGTKVRAVGHLELLTDSPLSLEALDALLRAHHARLIPDEEGGPPVALPPGVTDSEHAVSAGWRCADTAKSRRLTAAAWNGGPNEALFLTVSEGEAGRVHAFRTELGPRAPSLFVRLMVSADGQAVFVHVNDVGWSGLYSAHAPTWVSRPLYNSKRTGRVLEWAGQTDDGRTMYLCSPSEGARVPPGEAPLQDLWRLDAATESLNLICKSVQIGRYNFGRMLLASPDGRLLATHHWPLGLTPGTCPQEPLFVVDVGSGRATKIMWHEGGAYIDTALAWSAEVPNRLFATDLNENVWQLDLPSPPAH